MTRATDHFFQQPQYVTVIANSSTLSDQEKLRKSACPQAKRPAGVPEEAKHPRRRLTRCAAEQDELSRIARAVGEVRKEHLHARRRAGFADGRGRGDQKLAALVGAAAEAGY